MSNYSSPSPVDTFPLCVPCARVAQPPRSGVFVLHLQQHPVHVQWKWPSRHWVSHHWAQIRERTRRHELHNRAQLHHRKRTQRIQLQLFHIRSSARRYLQALLVPYLDRDRHWMCRPLSRITIRLIHITYLMRHNKFLYYTHIQNMRLFIRPAQCPISCAGETDLIEWNKSFSKNKLTAFVWVLLDKPKVFTK